jgi:hypothetical protein
MKNAMERYIKGNAQEVKDVIVKENAEIVQFLNGKEVDKIFKLYEPSLRHIYRFYAAQDKLDWADHNKENMNLREFVRFSFQHRIIPALIERPDDIVKLFKHAVKADGSN